MSVTPHGVAGVGLTRQGLVEACKQVVVSDQIADDAGAERIPPYAAVGVSGDEDDRDLAARGNQPFVQL